MVEMTWAQWAIYTAILTGSYVVIFAFATLAVMRLARGETVLTGKVRVPPAEVWLEESPEERMERMTADGLGGMPDLRLVKDDDHEALQFTEDTIQRGVRELLAIARAEGEALSPEDARDEVIRMLNADAGAEIE